MENHLTLKLSRNGMKFVLASIAVNALIGIVAIVSGDFSDLDAKILITSMSVTGGSVLALANLTARGNRFINFVPEAGAVFSVVGFSLLIYGAWTEFDFGNLGKATATAILFSSGTAHAGLLSRSRLLPRYTHVLTAAWLLAAVLVGMITVLIWASDSVEGDIYARVMGVVIVLLAAATLAVPVLHRAGKDELQANEGQDLPEETQARYCPNCGSQKVNADAAPITCGNCGAEFTVDFSKEQAS